MSDQDLSKLLQEHDLSPDKWVPLFHNEGIHTKTHVIANQGSELFESLFSEADTDREKKGLRRLLQVHEPIHNADSEIQDLLTEAGLESPQWLSILKTQLGVRTPQGLQHIGSESYAELQQFASKPWEKKAIRKLLGMENEAIDMKSVRKKQKEKLQQRRDKYQQKLEELKNLQKQGKDYHDRNVKQLIDGVQEALQIPEGILILSGNSVESLIQIFKTGIDNLDEELNANRDQSEVEVLKHASVGRALQGTLVSRNLEDQLVTREKLLSVPQDVQFRAPFLCRDDKVEEFSSQYQEDQFTKSMDRLGYGATPSAEPGFLGFGAPKRAPYTWTTEKERMGKHHQKERYRSTIKYSFMPMASFHFKDSQLQLSADALRDLQAIEYFHGPQTALQEQCETFFHKYGSHANKGHFHFGGIYWLRVKSSSHGFLESEISEVKKLQKQVVSASVHFSHASFEGSVESNVSKLNANFQSDFSEALMSKTTMEVTKKGGPQAAFNIPLWKIGLVTSNITWSVIDCGSNIVPVWEIIQVRFLHLLHFPTIHDITLNKADAFSITTLNYTSHHIS